MHVQGYAGVPVVLPVGGADTTGYAWTVDLPGGVEPAGESDPASPGGDPGDATGSRLLVVAPEAGTYTITAVLGRAWEAEPLQTVTVLLTVQDQEGQDPVTT